MMSHDAPARRGTAPRTGHTAHDEPHISLHSRLRTAVTADSRGAHWAHCGGSVVAGGEAVHTVLDNVELRTGERHLRLQCLLHALRKGA